MKNIPVYAWDNGFGVDKFLTMFPDEKTGKMVARKLSFPSVTVKKDTIESVSAISLIQQVFSINQMIIEFEKQTYGIGNYAIKQDPTGIYRSIEKNKFQEPSETVKLLASLVLLFPNEDYIYIDNLALGLSLESYKEYCQTAEKHFQHKNFPFTYFTHDGMRSCTVVISNVTCYRQGVGAFWDCFFEIEDNGIVDANIERVDMLDKRYGICDIGDKTIDAHIFSGVNLIENTAVEFTNGISEAYKRAAAKLNNCPVILLEETYLNYILDRPGKKPLYWRGKHYTIEEIQPLCESAFQESGKEIVSTIKKQWAKQFDTMELLILCGGIANTLKDLFVKEVPSQIITMDEPQFANVRGYFKSTLFNLQHSTNSKVQNG